MANDFWRLLEHNRLCIYKSRHNMNGRMSHYWQLNKCSGRKLQWKITWKLLNFIIHENVWQRQFVEINKSILYETKKCRNVFEKAHGGALSFKPVFIFCLQYFEVTIKRRWIWNWDKKILFFDRSQSDYCCCLNNIGPHNWYVFGIPFDVIIVKY